MSSSWSNSWGSSWGSSWGDTEAAEVEQPGGGILYGTEQYRHPVPRGDRPWPVEYTWESWYGAQYTLTVKAKTRFVPSDEPLAAVPCEFMFLIDKQATTDDELLWVGFLLEEMENGTEDTRVKISCKG